MHHTAALLVILSFAVAPGAVAAQHAPALSAVIEMDSPNNVNSPSLRTSAVPCANGDVITAVTFHGRLHVGSETALNPYGGPSVVLTRTTSDGRVLWVRELAEEARTEADHINAFLHLEPYDDGALVDARVGSSSGSDGALIRIGPDGREIWRLRSAVRNDWVTFRPRVDASGRIVIMGQFKRGAIDLPGVPRLAGQRAWNSFIGEVDPADGRMRWARRIAGDTSQVAIARDGSILVAGWQRGRGDAMDALISRFSPEGRPRGSVTWRTPHLDNVLGVAPTTNGGALVLVNVFDGSSNDPRTRETQRLVGFDARLTPTFEIPLEGRWSHRLAESTVADRATLLSVGPTEGLAFQTRPDGTVPSSVVSSGRTVRVRTISEIGSELGSRDLTVPGHAFANGLEGRRDRGSILVSGILGNVVDVSRMSASSFAQRIPDPGIATSGAGRSENVARPRPYLR